MSDLNTLLREYADAAPPIRQSEIEHRRQRRRARPVVYAGIAFATIVVLVGVVALTRTNSKNTSRVATRSPAPCDRAVACPIATGQFLYFKSDALSGSDEMWTDKAGAAHQISTLVPNHREIWIAPDGSGRIAETSGKPTFVSARDKEEWVARGSDPTTLNVPAPSDRRFGPHGLGWTDTTQLPTTDTEALRVALDRVDGGTPSPGEDFVHVGDMLRETNASRDLREALYRFALTIPGVTQITDARDHSGRKGIGVARTAFGFENDLILDPNTFMLLGEQSKVVGPNQAGRAVGSEQGWTVYLRSGIVDSVTAVPSPG